MLNRESHRKSIHETGDSASASPTTALKSTLNARRNMSVRCDLSASEAIGRAHEVGRSVLRASAASADEGNRFVSESFAALRDANLLTPCVPQEYGGLGLSFRSYAELAAVLGSYCPSTAFALNMHCCTQLFLGELSDILEFSTEEQLRREQVRETHFEQMVNEGRLYAQSFSEFGAGVSLGKAYTTQLKQDADVFVVSGEKAFVSMAGHADYYGVLCTNEAGNICYLAVPSDNDSVTVMSGPPILGLRGTSSYHVRFDDVNIATDLELLPPGAYEQIQKRAPYVYMSIAAPFVGLAREAFRICLEEVGPRAHASPARKMALAELRVLLEQTEGMWQCALSTAVHFDPDAASRIRLAATQYTVMENTQKICAQALKLCGGRALLQGHPLERLYRDSRVGAVLRPWPPERGLELISEWQTAAS